MREVIIYLSFSQFNKKIANPLEIKSRYCCPFSAVAKLGSSFHNDLEVRKIPAGFIHPFCKGQIEKVVKPNIRLI
ncbi:MAG: hypothetical protein CM1200mP10_29230 [Candidatus Neomarinimicrobiota bacterium]|nr:MAG: hypothetical protein CM1200mP10_29230 [Candidatus Neomarinimicrobiota bacterium]